jgi:hypothetical protein
MSSSLDIVQATHQLLLQHPEIISELTKRLSLQYQEEKDEDGNVCFIRSDEVRPEFREVFGPVDVAHYLCGLFRELVMIKITQQDFHLNFPFPSIAEDFWRLVVVGEELSLR